MFLLLKLSITSKVIRSYSLQFYLFSLWYQSNQKFYGEINILFAFLLNRGSTFDWCMHKYRSNAHFHDDIFYTPFLFQCGANTANPNILCITQFFRNTWKKKEVLFFVAYYDICLIFLFNIVIQILEFMFFIYFHFLFIRL